MRQVAWAVAFAAALHMLHAVLLIDDIFRSIGSIDRSGGASEFEKRSKLTEHSLSQSDPRVWG